MTRPQRLLPILAVLAGALPAAAEDGRKTYLAFPDRARVHAQIAGRGGFPPYPLALKSYLELLNKNEPPGHLISYHVEGGTTRCEPGTRPCPEGRATPSVADPHDLPQAFEIEVSVTDASAFPDVREIQASVDATGGTSLLVPGTAKLPFPRRDGFEGIALDPRRAGLRAGAVAQADCASESGLCFVRVAYASDLRATFLTGSEPSRLLAQLRAVDGFMRDIIAAGLGPYASGTVSAPRLGP